MEMVLQGQRFHLRSAGFETIEQITDVLWSYSGFPSELKEGLLR